MKEKYIDKTRRLKPIIEADKTLLEMIDIKL